MAAVVTLKELIFNNFVALPLETTTTATTTTTTTKQPKTTKNKQTKNQ